MDRPVVDRNNRHIGRFRDMAINPEDPYPPATSLVLYRGFLRKFYAEVPWDKVKELDNIVRVDAAGEELAYAPAIDAGICRVRKDILDQQVVDTYNHKVIRVNDIHLLRVDQQLRIAHVDIGTRGLIRRLGWQPFIDRLVKSWKPKSKYLKDRNLLSWKYVQPVSVDPTQPIKIGVTHKQLARIPPADLSEILMDLDIHQRVACLRSLDTHARARLFERFGFPEQQKILEHLETKEAVELLSKMSADEAADLLGAIPPEQSRELLSLMESKRAKQLALLLGYEEDQAGGVMTTDFLEVTKGATVQDALRIVKERTGDTETIYYIYVVDENKQFVGTSTLRLLIAADSPTPVEQAIFPKPVYVYTDAPLKEVAFLMDKYKVSALPVLDKEKHLVGLITVDDVLHRVIPIAWRHR